MNREYRFGFNGKEKDDEWNGQTGSTYDFGARLYDARIGRWMTCDPLDIAYPYLSPYNFGAGNPIYYVDKEGKHLVPTDWYSTWETGQMIISKVGGNNTSQYLINQLGLIHNRPSKKDLILAMRSDDLNRTQKKDARALYKAIASDEIILIQGIPAAPYTNSQRVLMAGKYAIPSREHVKLINALNSGDEYKYNTDGIDLYFRLNQDQDKSNIWEANTGNGYGAENFSDESIMVYCENRRSADLVLFQMPRQNLPHSEQLDINEKLILGSEGVGNNSINLGTSVTTDQVDTDATINARTNSQNQLFEAITK